MMIINENSQPQNRKEALNSIFKEKWKEAIESEPNSLKKKQYLDNF